MITVVMYAHFSNWKNQRSLKNKTKVIIGLYQFDVRVGPCVHSSFIRSYSSK